MKLYGWPTASKAKEFTNLMKDKEQIITNYKNIIMSCIKTECEKGNEGVIIDFVTIMSGQMYSLFKEEIFEWLKILGYEIMDNISGSTGDERRVGISWEKTK